VLVHGFITASADKANPAQSADQPIVAEVCPDRKRLWHEGVCPSRCAAARGGFMKTKREKFLNKLKRFADRRLTVTRICYRPSIIFVNGIFC
jgi:hypothetical protein